MNTHNGFNRRRVNNPKQCPRCGALKVNRAMRKCYQCNGVLQWTNVDDAKYAVARRDGIYFWHRSIFNGIEGWVSQDYFDIRYGTRT